MHKKTMKLKDKVGMAVPKNTQTRFIGITYHMHPLYIPTFVFLDNYHHTLLTQYIKYRYNILILIYGYNYYIPNT